MTDLNGTGRQPAFIHSTATVEANVAIGPETRVWHGVQIRDQATIGEQCILGKGVFIDRGVTIGDRVKIQNYACLYHGSTIEDGVFIGPHVVLTNDRLPRAITPTGAVKTDDDWQCGKTRICYGASLGARAVVLPGVTVGAWAMVGAGAVVTTDVPPHALVVGCPARIVGHVCRCGERCTAGDGACPRCGEEQMAPYEEMRVAVEHGHLHSHA